MQDPWRLAELLCARLCHDLSGPLGSILGGIEVAGDDPALRAEALAVAGDAAVALGGRVRLLRAAWAGHATAMNRTQLRDALAGFGAARVQLDLSGVNSDRVFLPGEARVVLNVLLLALESLPGAGRLAVADALGRDLLVTIDGAHAAWPIGLATCLADEAAAWAALDDARSLQAPFTALLARRAGVRLSLLLPSGPAPAAPAPLHLALAPQI